MYRWKAVYCKVDQFLSFDSLFHNNFDKDVLLLTEELINAEVKKIYIKLRNCHKNNFYKKLGAQYGSSDQ